MASDTNTMTERESSNLMEATEPMENSPAVASTLPTKRKAEFDPAEEIGDENEEIGDENEEIEDEDEEIDDENEEIEDEDEKMRYAMRERSARYIEEINAYYRAQWIEPEWDVDSFDGLTYEASEYDTEFVGRNKELDLQEWLRFKTQLFEYKGFYVDPKLWPMYDYTDYRVYSTIEDLELPAGAGKTHREIFEEIACVCVERFNQAQKEKEEKNDEDDLINLEFVEVVGGVVKITNRPKCFITFKAKEKPNGPVVEYQAKGWSLVLDGNNYYTHYPILCRPAPPKPSNWNN